MKKQLLESLLTISVVTLTVGYLTGGGDHYLSAFFGSLIGSLYIIINKFKKDGNK